MPFKHLNLLWHTRWGKVFGMIAIISIAIGSWQINRTFLVHAVGTTTGFDKGLMGAGAPTTQHDYVHTLSNTTGISQKFNLSATSSKGFTVTVIPTTITIASGSSASVTLRVTIPNGTDPGILDVEKLTAKNTPPAAPLIVSIMDTTLASTDTALKIPTAQMGSMSNGVRSYALTAASSTTEFWPGVQTPTYGYNGSYLAPTLVITTGETIRLNVTNNLTETTTTHWHGLHLPPKWDGGPHQEIPAGTTWSPQFEVINQAATVWFHPHPHEMTHDTSNGSTTGIQVYKGMAGMIIIRDSASNALGLPRYYGVDEFPLVLQDREFNSDGTFKVSPNSTGQRKGDAFLVNGTLAGHLQVPAQYVRFHVLNGSNFRFYNVGFSDNRSFYQIASDTGLLNAPVSRTRMIIAPGERMEIVVDLSNAQGQTIYFANYSGELGDSLIPTYTADNYDRSNSVLFTMNVGAPTSDPVTSIPSTLNDIKRIPRSQATVEHRLTLMIPPSINGKFFDMETINITSTLDTTEIWSIWNQSDEPHPIHIHGSPFQILVRAAPPFVTGEPLPSGGTIPPDYEQGWKDTVIVHPGERVDLIKVASDYADPESPFMYHCHLLEHEDDGMMGQYIVQEPYKVFEPLVKNP